MNPKEKTRDDSNEYTRPSSAAEGIVNLEREGVRLERRGQKSED